VWWRADLEPLDQLSLAWESITRAVATTANVVPQFVSDLLIERLPRRHAAPTPAGPGSAAVAGPTSPLSHGPVADTGRGEDAVDIGWGTSP
jgi:hypothetical protein